MWHNSANYIWTGTTKQPKIYTNHSNVREREKERRKECRCYLNHQGTKCTTLQCCGVDRVWRHQIVDQHAIERKRWKVYERSDILDDVAGQFEVKTWDKSAENQCHGVGFFFTLVLLPNLKATASWLGLPCWQKQTFLFCTDLDRRVDCSEISQPLGAMVDDQGMAV